MHFGLDWKPKRWGAQLRAVSRGSGSRSIPGCEGVLVLKLGRYSGSLVVLLGAIFVLVILLFLGIVYAVESTVLSCDIT